MKPGTIEEVGSVAQHPVADVHAAARPREPHGWQRSEVLLRRWLGPLAPMGAGLGLAVELGSVLEHRELEITELSRRLHAELVDQAMSHRRRTPGGRPLAVRTGTTPGSTAPTAARGSAFSATNRSRLARRPSGGGRTPARRRSSPRRRSRRASCSRPASATRLGVESRPTSGSSWNMSIARRKVVRANSASPAPASARPAVDAARSIDRRRPSPVAGPAGSQVRRTRSGRRPASGRGPAAGWPSGPAAHDERELGSTSGHSSSARRSELTMWPRWMARSANRARSLGAVGVTSTPSTVTSRDPRRRTAIPIGGEPTHLSGLRGPEPAPARPDLSS